MRAPIALAIWFAVSIPSSTSAQPMPAEPDPARVRWTFGPLLVNPRVALTNAGVDDNVFNEPDALGPVSDFTMTVTPAADWWLRMGRTWMTGNVNEDLIWYQTYEGENSINGTYTANWLVPLNRLRFAVGGNWLHSRERPGYEIDARGQRYEQAFNGVLEIRALSRTLFGVRGERRKIDFDQDASYRGRNLEEELNRTVTTAGFTARYELTPLTSLTFALGRQEDRFEFSAFRDADSTSYDFGVSFDPFALISGSAQVGIRDYRPLSPDIPGYSGSTAQVNLSYAALGSTRVAGNVLRDVQYSFEEIQPYYLQTGFGLSVTQQIYGPLDVEGRLGRHWLDYTNREGVDTALLIDRVDRVRSYGFGVGYRPAPDLRVAFNVDNIQRLSDLATRRYDGLRYGVSATYGQQ
jgi:hypothetical protein